jgi:aspartokinase/homoserine dehydrogenase 1
MRVLKFGGTSVGTPDTIKGLLNILRDYYQRGERFTVVFSAFSKVTDTLIDMATKAGKGDQVIWKYWKTYAPGTSGPLNNCSNQAIVRRY